MKKAELKKHWLASNAVVAFVGVLLVAQSWVESKGDVQLLPTCTVPLPWGVFLSAGIILALIAVLYMVALKVLCLQRWLFRIADFLSLFMGFLVCIAFIVDWLGVVPKLTDNELLLYSITLGGSVFFIFIIFMLLSPKFHHRNLTHGSSMTNRPRATDAPRLLSTLLIGGFVLFLFILGMVSSDQSKKD